MEDIRRVVERAVGGDEAARAEFVQASWPDIYRIAYTILHDPHAAQDATQEACARAWSGIGRLRSPERYAVWLYRIVANECRRLRRRDERYAVQAEIRPIPTAQPPDDCIDVRRAIASLDAQLRIVVVLRYYSNLTSAEIAHVLSISPVTVRWRLMLAHRRLRGVLADNEPVPARETPSGV